MKIESLITPQNIMFALTLIGIIFLVYDRFTNPLIRADKKDALLSQQVQLDKNETERRFSEMNKRLDEAFALAQNHIHTVDTKVETLITFITKMNLDMTTKITELSTIINERIPKKQP